MLGRAQHVQRSDGEVAATASLWGWKHRSVRCWAWRCRRGCFTPVGAAPPRDASGPQLRGRCHGWGPGQSRVPGASPGPAAPTSPHPRPAPAHASIYGGSSEAGCRAGARGPSLQPELRATARLGKALPPAQAQLRSHVGGGHKLAQQLGEQGGEHAAVPHAVRHLGCTQQGKHRSTRGCSGWAAGRGLHATHAAQRHASQPQQR